MSGNAQRSRWLNYAACVWALLFAAPHVWWALGIPAGFPGGEANHRLMMTTWRYLFDVVVILLSAAAAAVALALLKPRGWIPRTAAWIACAMLSLRGIGGMVVDGRGDPIWWPAFLTGGILFGSIASLARTPVLDEATGELLAVEQDWARAIAENDAEAIGQYMADDWVIAGPDGSVMDKAAFLGLVKSGALTHDVMEADDMKARLYGNTAVVTMRSLSGGKYEGRPFRELERASDVFVRQEGQWKCVLTHLSRISQPEDR